MAAALSEIINHEQDQVVIIDLGPWEGREVKEIQAIGRPMDIVGRKPMGGVTLPLQFRAVL